MEAILHMTVKYLDSLLPPTLFKRIHRLFIIGISHITSLGKK
ncbi:LytTR family transcriptional regulator DNA-binding domain-containing protein [Pedobacter sp. UYP30]